MPAAKKKASSPQARKSKGKQRNEKLILGTVHGELVGTTWVDQKSRISQALVDEVTYKANCIEIFYTKTNGTDGSYYGQAGLIRGERLSKSPEGEPAPQHRRLNDQGPFPRSSNWAVEPVTALHNITDEGFTEKYQFTKMYTSTRPSATCTLTFHDGGKTLGSTDEFALLPPTDQDEALTWESLDKAIGNKVSDPANFLTKKPLSFEKVPDGFVPEVGQKIGIAVYRVFEITPEDAVAAEGTNMEEIYGPMFNTCIYTGEITAVHTQKLSFEHSINTFCGCSGAIIFLLDTDQVESAEGLGGKALAVHVGGHPNDNTRANVAFVV